MTCPAHVSTPEEGSACNWKGGLPRGERLTAQLQVWDAPDLADEIQAGDDTWKGRCVSTCSASTPSVWEEPYSVGFGGNRAHFSLQEPGSRI